MIERGNLLTMVRQILHCLPFGSAKLIFFFIAFDNRYVNIGPFRDACLPVGMIGPAAFHQALSNALLNIACRRTTRDPSEYYDSMRHHAQAVQLVNEGMSDLSSATSDEFIGAVIGFACYQVSPFPCFFNVVMSNTNIKL